jgi:3-oxoacyl-[acyl-carrier protein] reductase
MAELTGKTALVTGASRGIGRAIAERLGFDGAQVVVHYRVNEMAANQTVATIERAGGSACAIGAELGTSDGLDSLFAQLEDHLDHLDILVNNAAMQSVGRDQIGPQEFDRIFAVNVRAPFFIIQRALPLIREGGRIINVSSAATRIALRDFAYTMTKGAVETMGRVLANALGERGITVNTVAPGLTVSDMTDWMDADIVAAAGRVTALGRIGQPSDVADVVACLASERTRWLTGQVLDATGGLWLGPIGHGNPWLSVLGPRPATSEGE